MHTAGNMQLHISRCVSGSSRVYVETQNIASPRCVVANEYGLMRDGFWDGLLLPKEKPHPRRFSQGEGCANVCAVAQGVGYAFTRCICLFNPNIARGGLAALL